MKRVDTNFEAGERDAETRVVTAVAWPGVWSVPQAQENQTQIFPASLKLKKRTQISDSPAQLRPDGSRFKAILDYLYGASADQRIILTL